MQLDVKVSVIIRTLNEQKFLTECLGAVLNQEYGRKPEIIIVDSGSSDNTLEIAMKFGAKILHINIEDFTYGRALNMGFSEATGDIGVILSAHCIPKGQHWLANITKRLSNGNAVYSYSRQIGSQSLSKYSEMKVFTKFFPRLDDTSYNKEYCNNASSALLVSTWRKERFNEDLTGLEDLDLYRRLRKGDQNVCYCPTSVCVHIHEEDWGQIAKRYNREALAYSSIYADQRISTLTLIFFAIKSMVLDSYCIDKMKINDFFEIMNYRSAQFFGYITGQPKYLVNLIEKL